MSERLLHYVWENHLFPESDLLTTDGERVEVVSVGHLNTDAGPDFFDAHVIIAGTHWVGNVEVHLSSSDWVRHHHERDAAYNNVVLHVVGRADTDVYTQAGRRVKQIVVSVPEFVEKKYEILQAASDAKPCYAAAAMLPAQEREQWLDNLATKRLMRKANEVNNRLELCQSDWERVFFITMARAFGFGLNADAFEQWACLLPYSGAAKHRDNLFQINALFLGTAGFLSGEEAFTAVKEADRLSAEFNFLSKKFDITPMARERWRFLRLRPQNFPTLRMMQLAKLYHSGTLSLSAAIEAPTLKQMRSLLTVEGLQTSSLNLLILNGVIPVLYAYGQYRGNVALVGKAVDWLRSLPAENNRYTRLFQSQAFKLSNAAQSQAIMQLMTLCERKDCLNCRLCACYICPTPFHNNQNSIK